MILLAALCRCSRVIARGSESALQRLDYLIIVASVIVTSTIAAIIVRRRNQKSSPPGTICVNVAPGTFTIPPGTHLSRAIIMISFGLGMVSLFMTLLFCVTGTWELLPTLFVIRIPKPLIYTAYAALCLYYGWGILIVRYNVNYTPCYRSIAGNYYIATAGPYSIMRHPMYTAKALFPIIMFCTTGYLPFLIGLLSWTALLTLA